MIKIKRLILTPESPNVAGKFQDGEWVVSSCDCTNGSFTSIVPDGRNTLNTIFTYFKKKGNTNTVTLSPVDNQTINEYV